MKLETKKLILIEKLLKVKNEITLRQIENLLSTKDFWDELSEYEKNEINIGLEELEKGEIYNYESIVSKHRPE